MFTRALMSAYEGVHTCGNAFVVQTDAELKRDPRNHDEAMADDSSGWLSCPWQRAQRPNHLTAEGPATQGGTTPSIEVVPPQLYQYGDRGLGVEMGACCPMARRVASNMLEAA